MPLGDDEDRVVNITRAGFLLGCPYLAHPDEGVLGSEDYEGRGVGSIYVGDGARRTVSIGHLFEGSAQIALHGVYFKPVVEATATSPFAKIAPCFDENLVENGATEATAEAVGVELVVLNAPVLDYVVPLSPTDKDNM